MSFKFFKTAPDTKSETVLKLERIGRTMQLLEAIDAERANMFSTKGSSANGEITVKRVGAFDSKTGR